MKYGDLNLAVEWEVVRMIGRHQCQDASYHLLRVKYVVDKRWAQNITPRVTPAQSSGTKGEWVACFRWRGETQLILSFIQRQNWNFSSFLIYKFIQVDRKSPIDDVDHFRLKIPYISCFGVES